MLDRNALIRFLSALLGCALALCWAACESTETGNPPALPPHVTEAFLQRELVDDGLLVIGAAGAVLPGGSWIEITDLETGKSAAVQTDEDGSFRLLIADATSTNIKYAAWNSVGRTTPTTMSSGTDSRSEEPSEDPPSETPEPTQTLDAGSATSADSAAPAELPDAASPQQAHADAEPQVDAGTASDGGSDAELDDAAAQTSDAGGGATQQRSLPSEGPVVLDVTRKQ